MFSGWQKNWQAIIMAWTQPAPVVDKARQAEQSGIDKKWEDEGGTVKQPPKPVGEAPKPASETPAPKLPL